MRESRIRHDSLKVLQSEVFCLNLLYKSHRTPLILLYLFILCDNIVLQRDFNVQMTMTRNDDENFMNND